MDEVLVRVPLTLGLTMGVGFGRGRVPFSGGRRYSCFNKEANKFFGVEEVLDYARTDKEYIVRGSSIVSPSGDEDSPTWHQSHFPFVSPSGDEDSPTWHQSQTPFVSSSLARASSYGRTVPLGTKVKTARLGSIPQILFTFDYIYNLPSTKNITFTSYSARMVLTTPE